MYFSTLIHPPPTYYRQTVYNAQNINSGCFNTKGNLSLTSSPGVKRNLSSCITHQDYIRLYFSCVCVCVRQSICLHHSACHMMLDLSHHAPLTTRSLRAQVFGFVCLKCEHMWVCLGMGVSELLGSTKTHIEPIDSNVTDRATNRKLLTFLVFS